MLVCNDVRKSLEFYTNHLGFEKVNYEESIGLTGFASLELGSIKLMLCSPSYYDAPQQQGDKPLTDSLYYYYVSDVQSLKDRLERAGVFSTDIKVRFYGLKEVETRDPDGRILIFGEETDEPPDPED